MADSPKQEPACAPRTPPVIMEEGPAWPLSKSSPRKGGNVRRQGRDGEGRGKLAFEKLNSKLYHWSLTFSPSSLSLWFLFT